jgi:hypothetical protein
MRLKSRLGERRHLRRAAEQALTGGTVALQNGSTGDQSDPDTGPIPRAYSPALFEPRDPVGEDSPDMNGSTSQTDVTATTPLPDWPEEPEEPESTTAGFSSSVFEGDAPAPTDDAFGGLTFPPSMTKLQSRRWYRTKLAMIAFIAAAVAIVVSGVLLVMRTPTTTPDESSTVPPSTQATTPTAVNPTPAPSSAPPPPPAAPPPPSAAPSYYPQPVRPREAPAEREGPQINVTRTPAIRSPFSATPPPPQTPQYGEGYGR